MDFELTEEQRMIQVAVRDFAEKELAPLVEEAEAKEQFPPQILPRMGDLGHLLMDYPVELGGAGTDYVSQIIAIEEIARICHGFAHGVWGHGMGCSPLYLFGSEEQKKKYLPGAIKGRKISAYAITEPGAGTDLAGMQSRAVKDGDSYILNGNKIFITLGHLADFVTVCAYTDRSKGFRGGMSWLIVEKGTPGFSTNTLSKMGDRPAVVAELAFEDCRIPRENLIGEEGRGWQYMMETINVARIGHAGRGLGLAQAALEASLNYAKERIQFGEPLKDHEDIRFRLARMATQVHLARWITYQAAWQYDQRKDYITLASMAKLFVSEVAFYVANEAVQIHGGYGLVMDYPIQRYCRDARVQPITIGTSEAQLMVIARQLGL